MPSKTKSELALLFILVVPTCANLHVLFPSSDVGFPVEVDDEYWPHNSTDPAFVPTQPAGIPPRAAFFNCYLKLIQILGFALRTIVSATTAFLELGATWEGEGGFIGVNDTKWR